MDKEFNQQFDEYMHPVIPKKYLGGYTEDAKKEVLKNILQIFAKNTQRFGFTMTFRPEFHSHTPDFQYHQLLFFKRDLPKSLKYIIVPEFTEKGNLHFHGIIFNEYDRKCWSVLKKWQLENGFVYKSKGQLTEKYAVYICKDLTTTGYGIHTNP